MDFTLSPDWPALWCYFIVLGIGFLVASVQVDQLFQGFPQAWIMFSTWVVFSIFLLLPVGLFWLLDRTNTIHDTSLFGAILVAVAYRQLFMGSVEKVNVPGQASKIWEKLLKWVDEQAVIVRKKMERNADKFDQKVISFLTEHDDARDKVFLLLKFHSKDFAKILEEFAESEKKWQPLGPEVVKRKAADFLYTHLRLVTGENFTDLMHDEGITTSFEYYWYGKEWRSRLVQGGVIGALVLGSALIFYQALFQPRFQAAYHLFRLKKVNATVEDRSRTRREIANLMSGKETGPYICDALATALRYEVMPIETADHVLAVLLEHRNSDSAGGVRLAQLLADALRTENPDVRARIHNAVLFLSKESGRAVDPALGSWKPAKSDSADALEDKIRAWNAALKPDTVPPPAAVPTAAAVEPPKPETVAGGPETAKR